MPHAFRPLPVAVIRHRAAFCSWLAPTRRTATAKALDQKRAAHRRTQCLVNGTFAASIKNSNPLVITADRTARRELRDRANGRLDLRERESSLRSIGCRRVDRASIFGFGSKHDDTAQDWRSMRFFRCLAAVHDPELRLRVAAVDHLDESRLMRQKLHRLPLQNSLRDRQASRKTFTA